MTVVSITRIFFSQLIQGMGRWIRNTALLVAGIVLTVTVAVATPLAGTVITAHASATFNLEGSSGPETVSSNTVIAIVQPVRALTLSQDNNFPRPAASTVAFAHLLGNAGNIAESYIFTVDETGCPTPNLGFQTTPALYLDINGNGIVDAGDRKLTLGASAAISLAPGELAPLLLQARVPLAANGGKSCVRLVATAAASEAGAMPLSAQNLDTVRITSNAVVVLNKAVRYSGLAVPGSTILDYTVNANNIGNSDAKPTDTLQTSSSILVDGQPRAVVLMRDRVPAGTQYVAGSLQTAVVGALRLFRLASDAPYSYHSEPAPVQGIPSGRDDSSAVEVAIGLPVSLPPNASVSMGFQARLLAKAGAWVTNTAWADFNDGATSAESTSNTVAVHSTSQALGLSKAASVPLVHVDANGVVDGTATVRFQLVARNFGTGTLYDVGLSDLLEDVSGGLRTYTTASVPGAGRYTVVAHSARIVSVTGAGTVAMSALGFTGQAGHSELLSSGAVLPPGGSITLQFDVRFSLSGLPTRLFNSASAHAANQSNGPVALTAQSSNGLDPDPNRTGSPAPPEPTPYTTQLPVMELLKTVSPARSVSGARDAYDVDIALQVTNVGPVEAPNVRLADNLFCAFQMDQSSGPVQSWQITQAPKSKNGLLTPSGSWSGGAFCDRGAQTNPDNLASYPFDPSVTLVDGSRALAMGASETIQFSVRVKMKPAARGSLVTLSNRAWAGWVLPLQAGSPTLPGYNNGQVQLAWATSSAASMVMLDPSGVVYNALTRQPVANAVVTLTRLSCPATAVSPMTAAQLFADSGTYQFNGDGSVSKSTDANGIYSFIFRSFVESTVIFQAIAKFSLPQ